MIPQNPYITGNPVSDSLAFVGRTDVMREVLQVLKHSQNNAIVLFGQRRIGKTSVLHELTTKLPKKGPYYPVFFDLLDKSQWPLELVLRALAKKISEKSLQETPDLGADPETTFCQVWLPELLKKLPTDKALVLLFDEFDVLDEPENETAQPASAVFFPYVRDLLSIDHQRLNFVFVIGRKIDDMTKIALSLFKATPTKRVSLLNQEDTAKLIRLSEMNKTLNWTDKTIETIWQLTNGHPYLTQHFCSRVWENIYDKNPDKLPTVTLKDVEGVEKSDILEASRNALEWLWDGLPPAEKVVASALAGAGAKAITEDQLKTILNESGVRTMIQSLQNAPRILQDWDLIEPADGGYRFRVELLRRWIAESKPLKQVQEELDRIEPIADDLYKAAKRFYAIHKLDDALTSLRQAVSSNPNHVGANLLLADILLAKKESNEACEILGKLYTYQSSAAIREKLIQALLALAHSSQNENEQLKIYERILEIDAAHPEARSQWQKIWRRRGDIAFKKKDFNGTLEAYQTAHLDDKTAQVEQEIQRRQGAKKAKLEKKALRNAALKGVADKYLKGTLEVFGFVFALVVSYYWFESLVPKEPVIILEVEKLKTAFEDVPAYSLTSVVSDKHYLLESVTIYPNSNQTVKRATFKYNIHPDVDLVKNQSTIPYYSVSKKLLQTALGESSFSFELLFDARFVFYFQFEGIETHKPEFECKVFAIDNLSVPCEVKEKRYLSLFRGIPWFWAGTLFGILLFLLIQIVYAFIKRERDDDY